MFVVILDKYYVDTTFINVPRSNMEIQSYMKDGMIDNWDLFEKVLDHTYKKVRKMFISGYVYRFLMFVILLLGNYF